MIKNKGIGDWDWGLGIGIGPNPKARHPWGAPLAKLRGYGPRRRAVGTRGLC